MSNIIDGRALAQKRQQKLQEKIKRLAAPPKVVSILVGDDPSSVLYTQIKQKKAGELGIDFQPLTFSKDSGFELVAQKIQKLNHDSAVSGIMVQLPLPGQFLRNHTARELLELIGQNKDIDGLTNNSPFLPAAVLAIVSILGEENIQVAGKRVVVLGSSDLVGKPAAKVLAGMGARVEVCDKQTLDIREKAALADILVCATGSPLLVKGDWVKEGVVLIDVGAETVNGKLVGDVDFLEVAPKAGKITPVPGGVGPMTVISLMENVYKAAAGTI